MRKLLVGGLLVALALAGIVSFYASSRPDGLEKVAQDKGFSATATDHDLADSPVADYAVTGVDDSRLSGGLAGVLGVLATFAIGGALFLIVRPKPTSGKPTSGTAADGDAAGGAEAGGDPVRR